MPFGIKMNSIQRNINTSGLSLNNRKTYKYSKILVIAMTGSHICNANRDSNPIPNTMKIACSNI
jgi:hypothetical protein